MRFLVLLTMGLVASLTAIAADAPQPVLLHGVSLHGSVEPQDLVAHKSAAGCLQTGVYEPGRKAYIIR